MYQNQVQNKPTAAYWLSMIGGIIGLLGSLAFFALGALAFIAISSYDYYYGDYLDYSSLFGWSYGMLLGLGIWGLICSILVITFARKLKANPMEHSKWGILIMIFSIIGVGGFVGAIFGFIGGILAFVYKPQIAGAAPQYAAPPSYAPPPQPVAYGPPPQQQYQQPMAHNCPQCGTMVQPNVRFCPTCGKQQY